MICKQCKAEDKTSRVMVLYSSTTAMACTPYYDEQGFYHKHDPNRIATYYACTNGHKFHKYDFIACPSCDYRVLILNEDSTD